MNEGTSQNIMLRFEKSSLIVAMKSFLLLPLFLGDYQGYCYVGITFSSAETTSREPAHQESLWSNREFFHDVGSASIEDATFCPAVESSSQTTTVSIAPSQPTNATVSPVSYQVPVNLQAQATIEGAETQIVTIRLLPGQTVRARPNMMLYMTRGVHMTTALTKGVGKRFLTGYPLFQIDYTNTGTEEEKVALGSTLPSKILSVNLDEHSGSLNIRKNSLLLVGNVNVETKIRSANSLKAKLFGAQGFFLQSIQGQGDVLLRYGGALIAKRLDSGEKLRIAPRTLLAYTSNVKYDVERATSIPNVLFGDEQLFVTTLEGPGIVWLQGFSPHFFRRREIIRTHSSSKPKTSSSSSSNRKTPSSSSSSSSSTRR